MSACSGNTVLELAHANKTAQMAVRVAKLNVQQLYLHVAACIGAGAGVEASAFVKQVKDIDCQNHGSDPPKLQRGWSL